MAYSCVLSQFIRKKNAPMLRVLTALCTIMLDNVSVCPTFAYGYFNKSPHCSFAFHVGIFKIKIKIKIKIKRSWTLAPKEELPF